MATRLIDKILDRRSVLYDVSVSSAELRSGVFGSVCTGQHERRAVAIKWLRRDLIYAENGQMMLDEEEFLQEISDHRALQHENLALIYGVLRPTAEHNSYGIVFQLFSMSLCQRYSATPGLTTPQHVMIGQCVIEAIAFLHEMHLLHRCITTHNIMVKELAGGRVQAVITEMGVPHSISMATIVKELFRSSRTCGYLAPEMIKDGKVDSEAIFGPYSEVYFFGAAMLAMYVCHEPQYPHANLMDDLGDMIQSHPMCVLIEKCLRENQFERPSAKEVADELHRVNPEDYHDIAGKPFLENAMVNGDGRVGNSAKGADVVQGFAPRLESTQPCGPMQPPRNPDADSEGHLSEGAAADIGVTAADMTVTASYDRSHPAGIQARCLLALNLRMTPQQPVYIKWHKSETRIPDAFKNRCPLPCVHKGHAYCAFRRGGQSSAAVLCRVRMASLSAASRGEWEERAMPGETPRHWRCYLLSSTIGLLCVCINDKRIGVYEVWIQADGSDAWRQIGELSWKVYRFGIALHGVELVVVGGRSGPLRSSSQVKTVRSCRLPHDPLPSHDQLHWTDMPDLPHTCATSAIVMHHHTLQVFGRNEVVLADASNVLSLDMRQAPMERVWVYNDPPPTPRKCCGALSINNQLITSGGTTSLFYVLGNALDCSASAFMYVRERQSWLPLPSLNTAQIKPVLLSDGERLLCFGGDTEKDSMHHSIEILEMRL